MMPMPPAMNAYRLDVSSGRVKLPFGCSTSTAAPSGISTRERLKAVSRMRVASPSTPFSVGDVTTVMCRRGPFSSS